MFEDSPRVDQLGISYPKEKGMFGRLKAVIDFTIKAFGNLSVVFIAILAVLVAYSALSRYVLDKAIPVTEELGGLLFLGICFTSIAPAFVEGRHVRFSLVAKRLSLRAQNALDAACSLVALFALSIYIKEGIDFAYESYLLGCRSLNARIYEVPWMFLMPICMFVLAMALLVLCVDKIRSVVGRE